jgi:hypothetical protein
VSARLRPVSPCVSHGVVPTSDVAEPLRFPQE